MSPLYFLKKYENVKKLFEEFQKKLTMKNKII